MEDTPRFALPYLTAGQAQKEFFHNEALQRIDFLLCPVVEEPPRQAPPANPVAGQAYLISAGASGAWAGHDGDIVGFGDGGWRFIAAIDGASALDRSSGQMMLRRNGVWETGIVRGQELRINDVPVVRGRQPAIAAPTGGTSVDTEGRVAIAAIVSALRAHGLIAP